MTGPDLRRFPDADDLPHLHALVTEMDWTGAACRVPEVDTTWFFPGRGNNSDAAKAKAVCATCPADVRTRCLAWAMEHREPGIWGGTSNRERRVLRGWTPGKQTAEHGYTHWLGGCRCDICRAAKSYRNAVERRRTEGGAA